VSTTWGFISLGMVTRCIIKAPLYSRGWTVQQRLLPPRSLLFTETQVFWECHKEVACEGWPDGFPAEFKSVLGMDKKPYAEKCGTRSSSGVRAVNSQN
jgi:hypothetical protein